jgi:hypothetical protein
MLDRRHGLCLRARGHNSPFRLPRLNTHGFQIL